MEFNKKPKILIVGGGVIGLSIARELHIAGVRDITVVDKGTLGREASWAAAGMLAPNVEAEHADDFYKFCAASNEIYPNFVRKLVDETGCDIDYRKCGTIEIALSEDDAAVLSAKLERQKLKGFKAHALDASEILSLEPSLSRDVVAGIHYPDDGYVDNRQLVGALSVYLRRNEIDVLENVKFATLSLDGDRITGAIVNGRTVDADLTILATGAWSSLIKIGDRALPIDVKPIKGQMVAFADRSLDLRKVIVAPGAYLTPRVDGRILVGATVENVGFDKAINEEAIDRLIKAARQAMPTLERVEPAETWCGFRPFASDGMPIIGGFDEIDSLFVATAHFRNGILLAPLTAKIVADKIVDKIDSPFLEAFRPQRSLTSSGVGTT